MSPSLSPLPSLQALTVSAPLDGASGPSLSGRGHDFQQVFAGMAHRPRQVQVQEGDTLIGLVKAHYRQNHQDIDDHDALRLAKHIADRNHIDNPDVILPGQKIDFTDLRLPPLARAPVQGPLELNLRSAQKVWDLQNDTRSTLPLGTATALATRPHTWTNASSQGPHAVLERTLARAVAKGFVPAAEVPAVRDRVLALAERYNFQPDDFARLTLMESGGMNPQASNGNCHGIIQFCDGANRGAASVGFKDNPRAILGVGLLQQLDLVDKYFAQAGLRVKGPPVGLDDLYLTVLTPAARQERRPDAPLPIAGPQARYLHVGQDTQGPITRNSILAGLHQLTQAMLPSPPSSQLGMPSTPGKASVARLYDDVAKASAHALR